jgi:hypothetical protein
MKWYKTANYDEYKQLSKKGKEQYNFIHLNKNDNMKGMYSTFNSYVLIFNTVLLLAVMMYIVSINNKTLVPEYIIYFDYFLNVMKVVTVALVGLLLSEVVSVGYNIYKLSKLR